METVNLQRITTVNTFIVDHGHNTIVYRAVNLPNNTMISRIMVHHGTNTMPIITTISSLWPLLKWHDFTLKGRCRAAMLKLFLLQAKFFPSKAWRAMPCMQEFVWIFVLTITDWKISNDHFCLLISKLHFLHHTSCTSECENLFSFPLLNFPH